MIALIQSKGGNATSSVTITPTRSPTSGNLLILCVGLLDTGSTITVPTGFAAVGTVVTSGTTCTGQMYWKLADGTESTLVVSKSGTANNVRVDFLEYSGTSNSPLDQTATTTSAGVSVTTLATASITPTVTNFIIVAMVAGTVASTNTFSSWGKFTSEVNDGNHRTEAADLNVSGSAGSGAYSVTPVWTQTGVATTVIANFKSDGTPHGATGLNNFQGAKDASAGDTGILSFGERIR